MKEVKRYRVSYKNGVIEEDGSPRSPHDSEPMVLAEDFDSTVKELEGKLKVAVHFIECAKESSVCPTDRYMATVHERASEALAQIGDL